MKVTEVIPYRRYRNVKNGRIASVSGACPWTTNAEKDDWVIETVGWTWRCDNGTTGLCRVPAKTKEEAEEVMRKFNARDWG